MTFSLSPGHLLRQTTPAYYRNGVGLLAINTGSALDVYP